MKQQKIPIDPRDLFHPLDKKLIELLKSLSPSDWNNQTIAKEWKVKDVASHLLDGNLRVLSLQRDKYFGDPMPEINGYQDLVDWLNKLNADWVNASKRLSPQVITMLLELTGDMVSDYYCSLDPFDKAIFAVSWAGEDKSLNWMHIAREYTERWHHQQQIRDTMGDMTIMNKQYFYPVIDTFFMALPHTFRSVEADAGTIIEAQVTSEAGGTWYLQKSDQWKLVDKTDKSPDAIVTIPFDISWKLFSKSLRPEEVLNNINILGNEKLGTQVLEMVSVMA